MGNDADIGKALVAEARDAFRRALHKIEHCLSQLSDSDVTWKPRPEMNSVAIVINHLCGNLGQWVISGLGGAPDTRDRPAEFVAPGPVTVDQLREKLRQRLREVDEVLSRLDPADLLRTRRVQARDAAGMHTLMNTLVHFVGHSHQIVQWTRLLRGEAYRFDYIPQSKEEGAPSA